MKSFWVVFSICSLSLFAKDKIRIDKEEIMMSFFADLESNFKKEEISSYRFDYIGDSIYVTPGDGIYFWSGFNQNIHPGKKLFSLNYSLDGKIIKSYRLPFQIFKKIKTPYALNDIEKFSKFQEGDFEWKEELYLTEKLDFPSETPIGATCLVNLRKGDKLRYKFYKTTADVEKGSNISIHFNRGGLSISARGRAMERGNIGDRIKVVGNSQDKTIIARVIGEREVEVEE
jgi:flagella basal body P-ring formation protein FlgA